MGKVEMSLDEYNAIIASIRTMDPISSIITEGRFKAGQPKPKPKRKGKPMTRKTQLAINRGRKEAGLKPIKWKKKGV